MTEKEKIIVIGSNCFSGASFVNYVLDENPQAKVIGISRSAEYNDVFLPYKNNNSDRFTFHCLDLNIDLDEVIDVIKGFSPDYIINFSGHSPNVFTSLPTILNVDIDMLYYKTQSC